MAKISYKNKSLGIHWKNLLRRIVAISLWPLMKEKFSFDKWKRLKRNKKNIED